MKFSFLKKTSFILLFFFISLLNTYLYSTAPRTVDNRKYDDRYDPILGSFVGSNRILYELDNRSFGERGGYSYLYRDRRLGETLSLLSDTGSIGVLYIATIGDFLPIGNYHPYVLSRKDINGFQAEIKYRNIVSSGLLYSRYNSSFDYTIIQDSYSSTESTFFKSTSLLIADLIDPRNPSDDKSYEEMVSMFFKFNLGNIDFLPEIIKKTVNEISLTGALMRKVNVDPNTQNDLLGSKLIDGDKNNWKVSIASPFEYYTNVDFESNFEGRIYSFRLRVQDKENNVTRYYDPTDNTGVVTLSPVNTGLDKGIYIEVNPSVKSVYHINLNQAVSGGVTNIKKAEILIDIANNYVVQLAEFDEDFEEIRNDGNSYPEDIVAINDRFVRNGSNRKEITFEIGVPSSRLITSLFFKGSIFGIFDYDYSYVINQFYRRFPSEDGVFSPIVSFANIINVNGNFFGGLMNFKGSYYYIDPKYSTSFIGYETSADNDDNDKYIGSKERTGVEIPFVADANDNGILDSKETFLIYSVKPVVFTKGNDNDLNHNNVEDLEEDDDVPELLYGTDKLGYTGLLNFHFENLFLDGHINVDLGFINEESLSTGRFNREFYTKINYENAKTDLGNIRIQLSFHNIKDNIINDLFPIRIPSGERERLDHLLFKKSKRTRVIFSQSKKINKYVEFDNHYFADINESDDLNNSYYRTLFFSRFKLGFSIIDERFLDYRAAIVYQKENKNNINNDSFFQLDDNKLYFINFGIFTPKSSSKIIFGHQHVISIDFLNNENNYTENSYVLEYRLLSGRSNRVAKKNPNRIKSEYEITVNRGQQYFSFGFDALERDYLEEGLKNETSFAIYAKVII